MLYDRTQPKFAGVRRGFPYAVVSIAVACALVGPAHAAAEYALEYAVFDPEAGTLEMHFDGQPAHGDLTLRPDGADSFLAYSIDAELSNVLDLDADAVEQFRNIDCPILHVGADSFLNANGAFNRNYTAPLWVVPHDGWAPPRPGVDVSCTLTYRILETPLTPSDDLLNAVHDGLAAWSELNPGLELRHIETGVAHISIKFTDGGMVDVLGHACIDCLYTFVSEQTAQDRHGPSGKPNSGAVILLNADISNYNTLRDAAAHEFGHNLGLRHHQSADHLMNNDVVNDPQIPYDDLGYAIPATLDGDSPTAIAVAVIAPIAAVGIITTPIYWWVIIKKAIRLFLS